MAPVYSLLIASSPMSIHGDLQRYMGNVHLMRLVLLLVLHLFCQPILAVLFENPTILLLEKSWITGAGAILFSITLIHISMWSISVPSDGVLLLS